MRKYNQKLILNLGRYPDDYRKYNMVHRYIYECHVYSWSPVNTLYEDVHFIYDIYLQ